MRKWLIVLMAAVAIGATGILGWLYMRQDRKGPEITIAESKKNSYTADMTTEDLLEGVKAVDKRDGDVSASLTVENVYPNEKGDEVTVVYVAKDNSNNVTKVTYHMTSEGNLMGFTSETKTSSDNTDTDAETDEALQDENETDSEDEEEPVRLRGLSGKYAADEEDGRYRRTLKYDAGYGRCADEAAGRCCG